MDILLVYLINVSLSFFKFLLFAVPIFVVLFFVRKKIGKGSFNAIVLGIVLLFFIFAAIQSGNTPKTVTYDRVQTDRELAQANLERQDSAAQLAIKDHSRPPKMSDQERSARFEELTDWRNNE